MADGLCTGVEGGDVIEKTTNANVNKVIEKKRNAVAMRCDRKRDGRRTSMDNVNNGFYSNNNGGVSVELFDDNNLYMSSSTNGDDEGIEEAEDECRKKRRCVDRYDSSESSDSGVAVLSCTDCSGSSTASSDIADPGSPFSTTSTHSEDSGSQPAKMPTTLSSSSSSSPSMMASSLASVNAHTHHHPPWPWAHDDGPPNKRSYINHINNDTALNKRLKSSSSSLTLSSFTDEKKTLIAATNKNFIKILPSTDTSQHKNNSKVKIEQQKTLQQGKITEYFRSQCKSTNAIIKKDLDNNNKSRPVLNKFVSLVDQQTQYNASKSQNCVRKEGINRKNLQQKMKTSKPMMTPRKILPAPANTDKITINEQLSNMANFAPTVTLTALSFPSNYATYLQKTQQKPDPIFVPQFAAITNDKIPIPIINRTPCLNVIQTPIQKIAAVNNFNCVKLNATVVPIVKVNTMPSRLNGSSTSNLGIPNNNVSNASQIPPTMVGAPTVTVPPNHHHHHHLTLNVETAVPTVLTAKPKTNDISNNSFAPPPKHHHQLITCNSNNNGTNTNLANTAISLQNVQYRISNSTRIEEPHRTEERVKTEANDEEKSPLADSDSGVSSKGYLELNVIVTDDGDEKPQQKSPILSQPKTIRFPARQQERKEELGNNNSNSSSGSSSKSSPHSLDGKCRWAECNSHFDTSGALLEHLQIKHVISQTSQEHFVCLWLGCKVHGRTSCSRSWLERHVLAHAGTKPFRCIVDGCGQRFNSQLMLERHVNGHFNSDGSPNNSAKKTTDTNAIKLFKRNGKRIRFRRQPWSARMFDFFDSGIMEGLQNKLLLLTEKRTLGKISAPGDTIHLHSQILARRTETDGTVKVLLRWHPADIIPDEWVHEKDYASTKFVPIPGLPASAKTALYPLLFSSKNDNIINNNNNNNIDNNDNNNSKNQDQTNNRQKHRRKPILVKQT